MSISAAVYFARVGELRLVRFTFGQDWRLLWFSDQGDSLTRLMFLKCGILDHDAVTR